MALVAKYSLNGNANDALGVNNGTATNITRGSGKLNQCATTTNGSISCGVPLTYSQMGSGLSIGFWFKMSSFTNNDHFLGISTTSGGQRRWLNFRCITRAFHDWEVYGAIGGAGYITFKSSIAGDTSRHYFVLTYNGSSFSAYLDSVLVSSGLNWTSSSGTNNILRLCTDMTSVAPMKGSLDEVEIYDHALNYGEIKMKYLYYLGYM